MGVSSFLRLSVACAIAGGLAACGGSGDVTSQVNPEFARHAFKKVMVEGDIADLKYRNKVETEFCDRITSKTGTECVRSIDVFFAGQQYTGDQVASGMAKVGADALLSLEASTGVNTVHVDGQTRTANVAVAEPNGGVGVATVTKTDPSYDISKPWATFRVTLISSSDRKMAWVATGNANGNAFSNWDDLIETAAKEVTSKLEDDGMLMEQPDKDAAPATSTAAAPAPATATAKL